MHLFIFNCFFYDFEWFVSLTQFFYFLLATLPATYLFLILFLLSCAISSQGILRIKHDLDVLFIILDKKKKNNMWKDVMVC